MKRNLTKIINEAYSLYMPQVRYEIEEFYEFLNDHYGFTKKSEPYNILEIGTKFGGTFYLWCSMNRSSGLNISIDKNDGGKHGGISEEKMDERDEWFKEKFENCHFIRGDSHEESSILDVLSLTYLYDFDSEDPFLDFLFIDGDHTYEGVKQDFEMYSPFLKKGSICAFHDIKINEYHEGRDVHVGEFWNELTKIRMSNNPEMCMIDEKKYSILEFTDNTEQFGGIGVLIMQ